LRVFFLFTLVISSVVLLAYYFQCNLVPQPLRYGTTMDMAICLSAVFTAGTLCRRLPRRFLRGLVIVLVIAAGIQTSRDMRYAGHLIQRIDVTKTTAYHLARWMNDHMQGQRVFVGGAHSFHFNAFTDTPQFHGGHDPMQPSLLTQIGVFTIYSGMNAGSRYLEICDTWLRALGTHAISVPGPLSDPYYKPFTYPERFEGHFPVLWREGDTTIYGVPSRSDSLAHVVPANSLVQHFPVNGLDIGEMKRYVAALEDPALPEATFQWLTRHSATVLAKLAPGQAISIQEQYMPGWTAVVNGQPQPVGHDGLGLMVLKPACRDCRVTIAYDGGLEWRATCLASLLVTLFCAFALLRSRLRRSQSPPLPTREALPAPEVS